MDSLPVLASASATQDLPVAADRYAAFLLSTLPQLAALPSRGFRRDACLDAALAAGFAGERPGIGVELGVYRGRSLRRSARRHPGRRFFGFDSLRGFPEDGRPDWQVDFAVRSPPRLPPNCRFVEGFFAETLPAFGMTLDAPIAVLNIDCDLHSSTATALAALGRHLGPGTAIHLDEAVNYDTWLWNEMLALFAFLDARGLGLRWIARSGRVRDLPATLAFQEAGRYPSWNDDIRAGFHRQAACVLVEGGLDAAALQHPAVGATADRLLALHEAHVTRQLRLKHCHPLDAALPPPPLPWWQPWAKR